MAVHAYDRPLTAVHMCWLASVFGLCHLPKASAHAADSHARSHRKQAKQRVHLLSSPANNLCCSKQADCYLISEQQRRSHTCVLAAAVLWAAAAAAAKEQ